MKRARDVRGPQLQLRVRRTRRRRWSGGAWLLTPPRPRKGRLYRRRLQRKHTRANVQGTTSAAVFGWAHQVPTAAGRHLPEPGLAGALRAAPYLAQSGFEFEPAGQQGWPPWGDCRGGVQHNGVPSGYCFQAGAAIHSMGELCTYYERISNLTQGGGTRCSAAPCACLASTTAVNKLACGTRRIQVTGTRRRSRRPQQRRRFDRIGQRHGFVSLR